MQRTELQIYINTIASCLGIVDLLSERRQYHQWYTIIKCAAVFTSQLSTNNNNIQQASDIKMKSEQYTSPYLYNLQPHLPILWSYINIRAIYITTITIFLKISLLYYETFQAMLDRFYSKKEALKIYESTNSPYDQRSGEQYKYWLRTPIFCSYEYV